MAVAGVLMVAAAVEAVVAAPLPDPTLVMPMRRRRARWRRRLRRHGVVLVCRLLPLELLVPLIARTPLLDLGLRSAYSDPQPLDPELRRLVARPALRPRAAQALRAAEHIAATDFGIAT